MKIIQEGDLSGYLLHGSCDKCKCEVEFYHNEEGVWWEKYLYYYCVTCPTPHCGKTISVPSDYIND